VSFVPYFGENNVSVLRKLQDTWSKQMLLGFSAGFCFFCF